MRELSLVIEDNLTSETKLWRYIDLAKLISLLQTKSLWLTRADLFKDRHEGKFPPEMKAAIENAYKSFDPSDSSEIKNADDFQEYLCKNSYITCWHKNADENMVMWELYGRDTNTIAIQTTVLKLQENLKIEKKVLYLKPIKYLNHDEVKGTLTYRDPFFIKRPHFSFESEVRILLSTYSRIHPSKNTPFGHTVGLNIQNAIEKILIHPDSDDWFMDVVKSLVEKYELNVPVEKGACGHT